MATGELEFLLQRIHKWRVETAIYRVINIGIFISTKFGVPAMSAVVAANLSQLVSGTPFISSLSMMWMSIAVVVLSGVDTFINPGSKKILAFKTNNKLAQLEEKLLIHISESNGSAEHAALHGFSLELKEILDEYADRGWGK